MNKDELAIITCPPLCDYPDHPDDHSECELLDCPKCKNKMWLSAKKKSIILFNSCLDREILLVCYVCLLKKVKENPEFFRGSEMVKI